MRRCSIRQDELAALDNEVLAMFETLMEQEPRRNVPKQAEGERAGGSAPRITGTLGTLE